MLQGMIKTFGCIVIVLLLCVAAVGAAVVINEVAWMGTESNPNDEWIELFNTGDMVLNLEGWTLRWDGHVVDLKGSIPAHGYYLLERTDDTTVQGVKADVLYTGSLRNAGEALGLFDAGELLADSANGDGGPWPAGDNATKASMQRRVPTDPDGDGNWTSARGEAHVARDAGGQWIVGTPGAANEGQTTVQQGSSNQLTTPIEHNTSTNTTLWIGLGVVVGALTWWWFTR